MADQYEKREEEEEEDEIGEQDYKAQKDALIFAIDVSETMLQPPPKSNDKKADTDPPVYAALKCAYQVMQQRIISNPRDMMGIVLFGTEKTKYRDGQNNLPYSHCYVYTDLGIPAAEDVKKLKTLVEDGEDDDEILSPSSEGAEMSNLLYLVNHLLTINAPNFGSRRLFIITDNDSPHSDKKSKETAATRAKDLYDIGVTVELFPITRGEEKFDSSKFYDDIIYRDSAMEEALPGRTASSKSGKDLNGKNRTLLSSLVSNINSRQVPKRAYFSNLPLELGPGLQISVRGYNIIQKQTPARSCYVWLDGEKAQIAVGETARIAEDSARTVQTDEVKKAYKFGGEYVYFSEDEQKSIKQFGSPIIRIIGFKDRSQLGFWASIKKSIFIFPSEDGYVGSTRVFSALWKKLLKSKKIGIAWHIARANGNPQLVAIIPSEARLDPKSGVSFVPAGLWLYPIPYADDVREGPEQLKLTRTTDPLTDRMIMIVRNLQLPDGIYDPSKYANPALQWHYKILQALALQEEPPDQPKDATVPKYKIIHDRIGGYIQDWSQTADEVLAKIRDDISIKRELEKGDEDEEPRPAKKPRTTAAKASANGAGMMNNAELKKRYRDHTLEKLTVVELRSILDDRGLDTKGIKKSLVEKLKGWIDETLNSVAEMDALFDSTRGNSVCTSVQDIQDKLHGLLVSKSSDTRAEHASSTFELRYNTIFHLTADAEDGTADASQQQPITRSVTASETIQNQPSDDPIIQRAVAKHIVGAMGIIDSSSWIVRQVARDAQGWTFTYICKDSLQAWNRANAKNAEKPAIASYSGPGGLDPTNASRPAFDCRGTLTIAFSKSARGVIVKYNHTPIHKTVGQLVDLLTPVPPPLPVGNSNKTSQRMPKAKRPPPTEGEEGGRKKRARKKGKAPEAPMGAPSLGHDENAQDNTASQTADQNGAQITSVLNVPPAEAERRKQTAIGLLSQRGIDPATLSEEQFSIFANQAPELQTASLEMLAKYGAERLRIVHPDENNQESPEPGDQNSPEISTLASANPAIEVPTTETTGTSTKKRRSRKKRSDGAVVQLESSGEVGTTASTLKPPGRKTRGSCETCKNKKVKCTKQHPSCLVCVAAGVQCVYLPPKSRRKRQETSGEIEQQEPDVADESELSQIQPQLQAAPSIPSVPEPAQSEDVSPSPDLDNEEFIPDPNILAGPADHQPTTTAQPSSPPQPTQYYQRTDNGLTFPQYPQPQSGHTAMPTLTFPESQAHGAQSESSPGLIFPSSYQRSTPSTTQHGQTAPASGRRSLPSGQNKQTPIPPPSIPAQISKWNASPTIGHAAAKTPPKQQAPKRQRSRKSGAEANQQQVQQQVQDGTKQAAALARAAVQQPNQPPPVTGSPYQAAARAKSRQGHRSQTSTPVATTTRPSPQAPQAATTASYNTTTTSSAPIPNYDAYARYDNSATSQYGNASNSQNPSRIAYEPGSYHSGAATTSSTSYSSAPAYDYTRSAGSSNPLSQTLNTSSGYTNTSIPATAQWPTSQTRGSQPNTSNAYPVTSTTTTPSHGYGARAAEARATQSNASYSQPQSQSYGSYSTSQANTNQQTQQNWYGFPPSNSNSTTNQNSYTGNRNSGYSSGTNSSHAASYSGHRPNLPNYSSHSYNGGSDDQSYTNF
ncbi:hypothetical protein GGR54DRAFT_632067 [Hypoxylon sp. NC1633]|nr:hypothetical protein GGR54DRAFT_632067 [Hypoxylon sp. NC1633]